MLRARESVVDGPVLLAGNSRGGALSVAYAGMHPDAVAGVINFVGGWMGDACPAADEINLGLLRRGAASPAPMIWLYGQDDTYYDNGTPARLFDVVRQDGANATLHMFDVQGANNGHYILAVPTLWQSTVSALLETIKDRSDE